MLKKRFSTTLLVLVVAAVIPGSAFAADVASESIVEVSAPTSVLEPVSSLNEADNGGSADATSGSTDADMNGSPDADNSSAGGADVIDSAQQEGDLDQDADVVLPKEDSEGEQTPDVVEPDPEGEGETIAGPESEVPTPEVKVEPTAPVVTEPEIPALEEIHPIVEEELVTGAAIVIEEPVLTTLTVTHILKLDVGQLEYTETINDIEVGTDYDISALISATEEVKCVSDVKSVLIDEINKTIVLEYTVVKEETSSENPQEDPLND